MTKNKLYNHLLSKLFNRNFNEETGIITRDKNNYVFGWDYNENLIEKNKIFYAIGCSWLQNNFFNRTFINEFPKHVLINRSIGGMGNSLIIDILKKDIVFFKSLNVEIFYLICFSEVGRNKKDFNYANPKSYKSGHDYFENILINQFKDVQKILGGSNYYVTTSFVNNCFNKNNTILDFCGPTSLPKPNKDIYHYSSRIHSYMQDRKIFNFDYNNDIKATLESIDWFLSHKYVDKTYHADSYKPYEDFFKILPINSL